MSQNTLQLKTLNYICDIFISLFVWLMVFLNNFQTEHPLPPELCLTARVQIPRGISIMLQDLNWHLKGRGGGALRRPPVLAGQPRAGTMFICITRVRTVPATYRSCEVQLGLWAWSTPASRPGSGAKSELPSSAQMILYPVTQDKSPNPDGSPRTL